MLSAMALSQTANAHVAVMRLDGLSLWTNQVKNVSLQYRSQSQEHTPAIEKLAHEDYQPPLEASRLVRHEEREVGQVAVVELMARFLHSPFDHYWQPMNLYQRLCAMMPSLVAASSIARILSIQFYRYDQGHPHERWIRELTLGDAEQMLPLHRSGHSLRWNLYLPNPLLWKFDVADLVAVDIVTCDGSNGLPEHMLKLERTLKKNMGWAEL